MFKWLENLFNNKKKKLLIDMVLEKGAIRPKKNHDAMGYDLYANEFIRIARQEKGVKVSTGLRVKLPKGYGAFVTSRSGISLEGKIRVQLGVIDNDYTGEIGIIVDNVTYEDYVINPGDRIAQLVLQEQIDGYFIEREELPQTKRGAKGFGSSGK